MKKTLAVLALTAATAAPAFAGSMHGADWGNLAAAILAPAPVVVVQPAPVYVAPPPVYQPGPLASVQRDSAGNLVCIYANGTARTELPYGVCPSYN
jgi:hypothetical protein